jgi:hypothetical protein
MSLVAWLRSRIGRLERRWIPNGFERARHQEVVSRRLRALAGRIERPR